MRTHRPCGPLHRHAAPQVGNVHRRKHERHLVRLAPHAQRHTATHRRCSHSSCRARGCWDCTGVRHRRGAREAEQRHRALVVRRVRTGGACRPRDGEIRTSNQAPPVQSMGPGIDAHMTQAARSGAWGHMQPHGLAAGECTCRGVREVRAEPLGATDAPAQFRTVAHQPQRVGVQQWDEPAQRGPRECGPPATIHHPPPPPPPLAAPAQPSAAPGSQTTVQSSTMSEGAKRCMVWRSARTSCLQDSMERSMRAHSAIRRRVHSSFTASPGPPQPDTASSSGFILSNLCLPVGRAMARQCSRSAPCSSAGAHAQWSPCCTS